MSVNGVKEKISQLATAAAAAAAAAGHSSSSSSRPQQQQQQQDDDQQSPPGSGKYRAAEGEYYIWTENIFKCGPSAQW